MVKAEVLKRPDDLVTLNLVWAVEGPEAGGNETNQHPWVVAVVQGGMSYNPSELMLRADEQLLEVFTLSYCWKKRSSYWRRFSTQIIRIGWLVVN